MSVVQFILLMLFFLNLYTSLLITLSCRYVVATNAHDLEAKIASISLKGPYMKYIHLPGGNMICQQGNNYPQVLCLFQLVLNFRFNYLILIIVLGSWIDMAKIIQDRQAITPTKAFLLGYYWSASTFSGAGFGDITAHDTTNMMLSICITIHGVLFFGYEITLKKKSISITL